MSAAWRRVPSLDWVELDGECVISSPDSAAFLLLNATASLVWQLLDGVATVDVLAGELAEAFGAEVDAVRDDVERLVEDLAAQGLVER